MVILQSRHKSKFVPVTHENWQLDNYIRANISYGSDCEVLFCNDTGDITDQIYDMLSTHEIYNSIKLAAISTYYLEIDPTRVKELLELVEKIDVSKLKKGKTY